MHSFSICLAATWLLGNVFLLCICTGICDKIEDWAGGCGTALTTYHCVRQHSKFLKISFLYTGPRDRRVQFFVPLSIEMEKKGKK